MNRKIIFPETPKSTNGIYKHFRNRTYLVPEGKAMKERYQLAAKVQWWKPEPMKEEFELQIDFFFKDKRKRDIDNYNKILLDSMNGIVWDDDCQITKLILTKNYDKNNPRCEVTIL